MDYIDVDESALSRFFRWTDRPFQVVANLLRGRPGAAGRQLVDFVGGPVSALIPGWDIPNLSEREDYTSGSSLLGVQNANPAVKFVADVGTSILLNPLTYLTGGTSAATNLGKEGAKRAALAAAFPTIKAGAKLGADDVINVLRSTMKGVDPADMEKIAAHARGMNLTPGNIKPIDLGIVVRTSGASEKAQQAYTAAEKTIESLFRLKSSAVMSSDDVLAIIQRNLTRTGKKDLDAVKKGVDDLYRQSGGQVDTMVSMLRDGGAMRDMVRQGGMHFGPWQITKDGAMSMAIGKAIPEPLRQFVDTTIKKMGEVVRPLRYAVSRLKPGDEAYDIALRATAAGGTAARAAAEHAATVVAGLSKQEKALLGDAFNAIDWRVLNDADVAKPTIASRLNAMIAGKKIAGSDLMLDEASSIALEKMNLHDRVRALIAKRSAAEAPKSIAVSADRADELLKRVDGALDRQVAQMDEMLKLGAAKDEMNLLPALKAGGMQREAALLKLREMNYLKRTWDAVDESTGELLVSSSSPQRHRVLRTHADVMSYINEGNRFNRDFGDQMMSRAVDQGRMVQRATLARELLGDATVAADHETMNAVKAGLEVLSAKNPDAAKMLGTAWQGLPHRGWVTTKLAQLNEPFKKAAVYGYIIPRFSGLFRNRISGPFQFAATHGVLDPSTGKLIRDIPRDMYEAMRYGFQKTFDIKARDAHDLTKAIRLMDEAVARGGSVEGAAGHIAANADPKMADSLLYAMKNGVTSNYASAEALLSMPDASKLAKIADMGGEMFNAVESRMRLGTFLDLVKRGYNHKSAARIIRDSFLDYSQWSAENRLLRDLFPFVQFTAKTIPQQAGKLTSTGAYATMIGALYGAGDSEEIVRPYIADQVHVSLGKNQEGQSVYLSGLGLPTEALSAIPMSMRDSPRRIISMSHPLLKYWWGSTTGEDPFFRTKFGSYDRAPDVMQKLGVPEHGEAGRLYNQLAQTGMIQPVHSLVQTLSAPLDDRKTLAQKMLAVATGSRLVTTTEDRAIMDILRNRLRADPSIKTYIQYYGEEGAAAAKELKELKKAMARVREQAEQKRIAEGG